MLAALLLFTQSAVAESPCLLLSRTTSTSLSLGGVAEVTTDPSLSLGIDEVRADDSGLSWTLAPSTYAKPISTSVTWIRLCIQNDTPAHQNRIALLDSRLIDEVDAWVDIDGQLSGWSIGEGSSVDRRPIQVPPAAFPISLNPGSVAHAWVRLSDEGSMTAPLLLVEPVDLARREGQHQLLWGGALALMFSAFALAFGAWIRLRDNVAGWFAATTAGSTLYIALIKWGGVGLFLSADIRSWWTNRLILASILLGTTAFGEYLSALLKLDERMPRAAVFLRNARWTIALGAPLLLPFSYPWQTRWAILSTVPVMVMMICALVLAAQGVRQARLYAVAMLTSLSTHILGILQIFGFVEATLLSRHGVAFSLVVLDVFLGVLAIDHVAEQRADRERALRGRLKEVERNVRLSSTFEKFVPKEFLDRLGAEAITDVHLGLGVQARMTVCFSDIRGFTSLVEKHTPEENFRFINRYLSYMEPPIHDAGGFIDKYIGDAVMALFDGGDDAGAVAGVTAAVGMHRALASFNATRSEEGLAPVRIGIGLHTGELMLGTIGGQDRLNASVIGDAVNLAARVEGMTKGYFARLLITESTADELPRSRFTLRVVDRVQVKGKTEPSTVYEVLDADAHAVREGKKASLHHWEAAWVAYFRRDFALAETSFRACMSDTDPLAEKLAERAARLVVETRPEGWDGVLALDWK